MKKEIKKIRLKKSTVFILNGITKEKAIGGASPTIQPTVDTIDETLFNCNTLDAACRSRRICPQTTI